METERTIGPLQPPPDHSISVHPSLEYQKDHQFGKGEYCTSPSQIKIKYYDQRHQQTMFQVGDVVWVRTHPLSKADEGFMPKLSPKWKALLKLLLNNAQWTSKSLVSEKNQITFIVTWPQHMCLGERNSWERAPDRNNLHMDSTYLQTVQKTMCRIHIHILSKITSAWIYHKESHNKHIWSIFIVL